MQNITKRCPETIGVDILGSADNHKTSWELLAGDAVFQLIANIIIIGNQSLRMY